MQDIRILCVYVEFVQNNLCLHQKAV